MTKPRFEPDNEDYFKDVYFLYDILNRFSGDKKQLVHFLRDFFSKSELRMFRKRWHISCLVDQGHDIRMIATIAKSSTETVVRVKKKLDEGLGGWVNALELTRNDREKEQGELTQKFRSPLGPLKIDYRQKAKPMDPEKFKRWVLGSGGPKTK